jgi:hypothetical protein
LLVVDEPRVKSDGEGGLGEEGEVKKEERKRKRVVSPPSWSPVSSVDRLHRIGAYSPRLPPLAR